jgi:hypothetical protein
MSWLGKPPRAGTEVFVGKLQRTLDLEDLIPVFQKVSY